MSIRTYHAFQALLLAALGLFLLQKIVSGTLFWYINQRFMILVLLAGVGCLWLAQTAWQNLRQAKTEHDHASVHEHDHRPASAWNLAIIALPVLLGLLIPARPLGTSAIANKGINTNAPLSSDKPSALTFNLAPEARTVLDWVRAFNYESDLSIFTDQPADVVGFVYHDPRLPAGQFLVGRFALNCCVADATAIGVAVAWPDENALADNSWVRVRGAVQATTLNGKSLPLIQAVSVEQVAEPDQPYLYP
jgi:uncharacterized repeat protein (TIGR03943 family)